MNNRPIGISILAFWFVLIGFSLLVLEFLFTSELVEAFSVSMAPTTVSMLFLAGVGVLAIAAGVTMWLGKPFGWWLGIAHLALTAIRNAWGIVLLHQLAQTDQELATFLPKLYLKHGLRVCLSLGVIYYFFRPQVLAYFKRQQTPSSA